MTATPLNTHALIDTFNAPAAGVVLPAALRSARAFGVEPSVAALVERSVKTLIPALNSGGINPRSALRSVATDLVAQLSADQFTALWDAYSAYPDSPVVRLLLNTLSAAAEGTRPGDRSAGLCITPGAARAPVTAAAAAASEQTAARLCISQQQRQPAQQQQQQQQPRKRQSGRRPPRSIAKAAAAAAAAASQQRKQQPKQQSQQQQQPRQQQAAAAEAELPLQPAKRRRANASDQAARSGSGGSGSGGARPAVKARTSERRGHDRAPRDQRHG
ncbi:hypothetical protein Rsub_06446 [Raphidocelis subcapitata]|uniref:Uncharacterized protein n=1 Tax=Raphidocelis subcapitata TaxID=307507 RepID=A0A2V0P0L4_9CHLO|nr:hypothetical protein Rsub_06446 [Raphidocelis subcapitata]|eukprot:GBF93408.1 hypothetical protein Rsub_06446 [Raphidocelis subcapitata]